MSFFFWCVFLLLGAHLAAPQSTPVELPAELLDWPVSVVNPRLSPDGRFLAFASAPDGPMDLFIADTSAGTVRRLTETDWNDTRPAWSPDGTQLVFQSNRTGNHELWIVTVESGDVRRLTQTDHIETQPDWSARGDWISYIANASGNWDVWLIRPDGTGARRLTVHDGNEWFPRFSPDGTQIVFYPTWSGWTDIYTVDVADGTVHEILSSEHEDFRPVWSADGSQIVFSSDRSDPTALWAVRATGGEPQPLLRGERQVDYPDTSADGRSIVYLETTYYSHLFQADLDGGTPRRLTSDDRNTVDRHPDVSPAGSLLAYETTRYGNEGNVALRQLSTAEEQRASAGRISDGTPRFSPSGDRVVFTQGGGDQRSFDAIVRDLKTGSEERWTDTGNVRYATFCGEDAIVFGWTAVSYVEPLELWYKKRNGPARRVGNHLVEFGGLDCDADGEWVVASVAAESDGPTGAPRLVRIELESGQSHVVTRGDAPHLHPRVSPDGQRILFVADEGNGSAAYVTSVLGGVPQLVIGGDQNVGTADWAGPDSLIYSAGHRRDAVRVIAVEDLEMSVSDDVDAGVETEPSRTGSPADSVTMPAEFVLNPEPVVVAGPPGAWDEGAVIAQWVGRGSGQYQMLYLGMKGHRPRLGHAIGYASSADGIVWEKSAANPLVAAETLGSPDAEVIQVVPASMDDNDWVIYAVVGTPAAGEVWHWSTGTMTVVRLASRDEGATWTQTATRGLERSPDGSWDSAFLVPRAYAYDNGTHYLFYDGSDLTDWKVGLAKSSDGTNWEQLPDPVFAYGPVACGEHMNFVGGAIRQRGDGSWSMHYTGGPTGCSDSFRTVGMATARQIEGPWSPDPANPILPSRESTVMVAPVGLTDADGNELLYISFEDEADDYRPSGVFRAIGKLPERN